MEWLDRELQRALERQEPSAEFTERVLSAARRRRIWSVPRWVPARWAVAAVATVVLLAAGTGYRRHRGAVAREQVLLAVRIAAVRLNHIQARVREVPR